MHVISPQDAAQVSTCRGRGRETFPQQASYGFTLLELLITITVMAVLTGMTLAAVGMVRESARAIACANGLRQIAMANLAYAQEFHGVYVPGYGWGRSLNHLGSYDVWTKWWINPVFVGYIDGRITDVDKWPSYLLCHSAKPDATHVGQIGRYYGYAFVTGSGIDFNAPYAGAMYQWRTTSIATPSESVMFDDSNDYIIEFTTNTYLSEADAQSRDWGTHITASRHRGSANCAFFDCHVQSLAKRIVEGYPSTARFWNLK